VNKYTRPDLEKSALITIDTQNDFTLDRSPVHISGTKEAVPNMVKLLDRYRRTDQLIIHVIRLYLKDGSNAELCRKELIESGTSIVRPGTEGAELLDALKPNQSVRLEAEDLLKGEFQQIGKNEYIMYKPRWGAFYQTRLEEFLNNKEINTLVFTGCNYPNCPRMSIYEASERDFRIVLVSDAISKLDQQGQDEMENIGIELLTTAEICNSFA
jgi:nicotinamidase-related amidase